MIGEIIFSIVCVVILFILALVTCKFKSSKANDVLLVLFLFIPPMSHLWHIIWGEGSLRNGDPIWDTYEIAVFSEILILRLYTTVRLLELQWPLLALISFVSFCGSFVLPFGLGGRAYDWSALAVDFVLIVFFCYKSVAA